MRPQVGQLVNNKYRLLRLIGDGGMGSVYEARHEVLGTTVALKFLHPELSRRAGLVQRFLQEARVSAQIASPHVARTSDVDQTSAGLAFIVMEYLEGKTLQTLYEELYRAGQRLSYADALEYAMQMLEGVEAAHSAGVVHRDLKPDNVMITRGARGEPLIKLLDFGIAKLKVTGELDRGLTRPGVVMGTPEYMAPEQAYSADAVDARADIFSLGVIIFEMLAGRRPVGGDEATIIASQYLQGQVARLTDLAPQVPADLAAAVHRAIAPMAKDRFASVAELRASIEGHWAATKGGAPGRDTPAPARATPAHPSPVSAATPATNPPDADGARAVPKTLPPEDEAPVPGPSPQASSVAVSASPATPLGGFGVAGGAAFAGAAAMASASPSAVPMADVRSPSSPAIPATAEAPPLYIQNGGGALPPTEDHAPLNDAPPRPGGTAVGGAPFVPEYGGGSTQGGAGTYGYGAAGGTASDPMAPYAPSAVPAPAGKRAAGGVSLLAILLLAGGVAAAVVGGVYIAHENARQEDSRDDPPAPQPFPTTSVAPTPSPSPTEPPPPAPPPTVAKPQPQPQPKPKPTASTGPAPTTSASADKPKIPIPILPGPITFPSGLPFPQFPGAPVPQPPPQGGGDSGGQPAPQPQPQPGPAPAPGGKPKIVIKVPKPG